MRPTRCIRPCVGSGSPASWSAVSCAWARPWSRDAVDAVFAHNPMYLVIDKDDEQVLMPAAQLARYLEIESEETAGPTDAPIDLLAIPAQRLHLSNLCRYMPTCTRPGASSSGPPPRR